MKKTSVSAFFCSAAALWLAVAGSVFAQAQPLGEGVILVNMTFNDDEWKGELNTILPCFGPSKTSRDVDSAVTVRAVGEDRKVYYERRFLSPRIVQVERGSKNPGLLKELDFVLKVPFYQGVQFVEFWDSEASQKPSVRVDVRAQAKAYLAAGGFKQDASCKFLPKERLTPAKPVETTQKVKNFDDSFAALKRMLDTDPEMTLTLAKNAGINVGDVRKYLDSLDDEALENAGFTRKEVDVYLKKLESMQ